MPRSRQKTTDFELVKSTLRHLYTTFCRSLSRFIFDWLYLVLSFFVDLGDPPAYKLKWNSHSQWGHSSVTGKKCSAIFGLPPLVFPQDTRQLGLTTPSALLILRMIPIIIWSYFTSNCLKFCYVTKLTSTTYVGSYRPVAEPLHSRVCTLTAAISIKTFVGLERQTTEMLILL